MGLLPQGSLDLLREEVALSGYRLGTLQAGWGWGHSDLCCHRTGGWRQRSATCQSSQPVFGPMWPLDGWSLSSLWGICPPGPPPLGEASVQEWSGGLP